MCYPFCRYYPYIRPQETGNRVGVRWTAVQDNQGRGIIASATESTPELHFSALHFTPEALTSGSPGYHKHAANLNEMVRAHTAC